MTTLVGALILLLLGMLGARFAFPPGEFGTGPRVLVAARWHFLLIGFLLGPHATGLLDPRTIGQLLPVILLGVAWIGLLFGSQFSYRRLRDVSRPYLLLLAVQAAIAFIVFATAGVLLIESFGSVSREQRAIILAAAATACVSGPLAIAVVSRAVAGGPITEFILLAGSLDGVVGVIALQFVGALYHPRELYAGFELFGPAGWLSIALVLGLAFGLLFLFLSRRKPSNDETVLFLLGLAVFLAGSAVTLGVFTVVVAMIAGMVVANVSRYQRRVYDRLQEWVGPIYIVLLVLVGSVVDVRTWWVVALGVGYAVLRAIAKVIGAWVARYMTALPRELPPFLGAGLIAQGGMSIVLALSVAVGYRGLDATDPRPANILLSVVAIGVLFSDLGAPIAARRLLGSAGELDPRRWFRRSDDRKATTPGARSA